MRSRFHKFLNFKCKRLAASNFYRYEQTRDSKSAESCNKIGEDPDFYQLRGCWSQNRRFCPDALSISQIFKLQMQERSRLKLSEFLADIWF